MSNILAGHSKYPINNNHFRALMPTMFNFTLLWNWTFRDNKVLQAGVLLYRCSANPRGKHLVLWLQHEMSPQASSPAEYTTWTGCGNKKVGAYQSKLSCSDLCPQSCIVSCPCTVTVPYPLPVYYEKNSLFTTLHQVQSTARIKPLKCWAKTIPPEVVDISILSLIQR